MDNQPKRHALLSWDGIKQTALSIVIGAAISLITIIMQEAVGYLQSMDPATLGVIVGVGRQLTRWRYGGFA